MMQCFHGCGLLIAMAFVLSGQAGASSLLILEDDWESGSIASADWNSWGSPAPLLQGGGNAVGNHSLDPNGNGSYLSGLVSANTFALTDAVQVSIDAYIESAPQWSELSFGLARTAGITQSNVHLEHLATVTIDADIQGTGYKFYAKFVGDGGTEVDWDASAEAVFDAWHNYVFDFAENGTVQVRVDDIMVFESSSGLYDYTVDDEFTVLLGGRSYGATSNLYDSIRAIQVPEPTTALLLGLVGLALLLHRRRNLRRYSS